MNWSIADSVGGVTLLQPAMLWLATLAAAYGLFAIFRKVGNFPSVVLRLLAILLLVLALADPIRTTKSEQKELYALFDVSHSILPSAQEKLAEELAPFLRSGADVTLNVLPFGKKPAKGELSLDSSASPEEILDLVKRRSDSVDTGQTNISAALQRVLSTSSSSAVLLLTDGYETLGDARASASSARSKGVKVFPIVPDETAFREGRVILSSLHAPLTSNAGDFVEIRASVKNGYKKEETARLEIWFGKDKLFSNSVRVPGGQERVIKVKSPPTEGGLHRIRAVLKTSSGNEERTAEKHRWVSVKAKSKILLINGSKDDRRIFGRVLSQKGYTVEDILADGNSEIPTKFEGYSSVVLNNTAKRQLPRDFLPALENFVSAGGGLLIIGGDRSYGLGEYIDTPLEKIAPVKFVPPKTTKRRLDNAVILVLDKSRSMVFQDKIGAAKRAALTSINALKDDDWVGVIGFDNSPFVIIELEKVDKVKPIAQRRLRNLTAAGKTNLLPALAAARRSLTQAKASRKHVIVLSDGKFPLAGNKYVEELQRLRRANISMSTVALGLEADVPFMKLLAEQGRGAFYHTLDPTRLPEIFLHDIKVTTGEKTLRERKRFDVSAGPDRIVSTQIKHFPHLKGFVETLPKKGAEIELVTDANSRAFPILASWQYDSGRVVAYTSDANGRWSDPWVRWKGFATFWGHIIERLKTKTSKLGGELDFDLRYSIDGNTLKLDLAVYDDSLGAGSSPPVQAEVIEPGGEKRSIAFETVAAGRFHSALSEGRPGDYKLSILYGKAKLPPLALTIGGDAFGERPGQGILAQTLSDVAFLSGGMINPSPEQVEGLSRTIEKTEHLFIPLVVLAFLLILLEAFVRELGPQVVRTYTEKLSKLVRNNSAVERAKRQLRKAA